MKTFLFFILTSISLIADPLPLEQARKSYELEKSKITAKYVMWLEKMVVSAPDLDKDSYRGELLKFSKNINEAVVKAEEPKWGTSRSMERRGASFLESGDLGSVSMS